MRYPGEAVPNLLRIRFDACPSCKRLIKNPKQMSEWLVGMRSRMNTIKLLVLGTCSLISITPYMLSYGLAEESVLIPDSNVVKSHKMIPFPGLQMKTVSPTSHREHRG